MLVSFKLAKSGLAADKLASNKLTDIAPLLMKEILPKYIFTLLSLKQSCKHIVNLRQFDLSTRAVVLYYH